MFVVHTMNQLEEAIRVGAGEILVTGNLAKHVHEAYQLKACKGNCFSGDSEEFTQMSGMPAWGLSSLLVLTDQFSEMNTKGDPRYPSVILQRSRQH